MTTTSDETDADLVDAITSATMPIVLIDRELVQSVDSVSADHRPELVRATEYLLSSGHRRIALLWLATSKAYPPAAVSKAIKRRINPSGQPTQTSSRPSAFK